MAFDEKSPCKECELHLAGIDKNRCVGTCEKITAYRQGISWQGKKMATMVKKEKKRRDTMSKEEKKEIIPPTVIHETKETKFEAAKKSYAVVELDFSKYSVLGDKIVEMADDFFLPIEHVVMTLLSEAIIDRESFERESDE